MVRFIAMRIIYIEMKICFIGNKQIKFIANSLYILIVIPLPFKNFKMKNFKMAPRAGLEPATERLTAVCSTTELPRNSLPREELLVIDVINQLNLLYQKFVGWSRVFFNLIELFYLLHLVFEYILRVNTIKLII